MLPVSLLIDYKKFFRRFFRKKTDYEKLLIAFFNIINGDGKYLTRKMQKKIDKERQA